MRGYKSRNTYTVSGTVGGFFLKPTDVKLSFYQAKDGTVVPKLHGVQQDEKLLQRPFHEHGMFPMLGKWKSFDEIDFDSLPEEFVLKCNHDSGSVKV